MGLAEKLKYGSYYHIYNKGVNGENIFINSSDYEHFIRQSEIYILIVADIIAWSLVKNHFHFVVRIKKEDEIGYLNSKYSKSESMIQKWQTFKPNQKYSNFLKKPIPANQFQHLFNAYARWFNIKHDREDSLFIQNYKKIEVLNTKYLKNLIAYVHNNPVKHGFVEHHLEYPWTSFLHNSDSFNDIPSKKKFSSIFRSKIDYEAYHSNFSESDESAIDDIIIE